MAQYERAFSTTRVLGLEQDTLVHYESSVSKVKLWLLKVGKTLLAQFIALLIDDP